jgi:Tol biopolymer transport system component
MRRPAGRVAIATAAIGAAAVAALVVLSTRDGEDPVRGDLIAYSCKERGNIWYAICVMRSDGTEKKRLTSRLTTSDPVWSPDGRTLAYTRHLNRGQYGTFAGDDIFVIDAGGDESHQLTETQYGRSAGEAAWSPDGREIAFVRGGAVVTPGVAFGAIFVVDAEGGPARRLTRGPWDTEPAWSPDGSRIAFTRATGPGSFATADVYVVGADGERARPLTRLAPDLASGAAWSPDGSMIAFTRTTRQTPFMGTAKIHVVGSDGSGATLLARHRHFDRYPGNLTWSPDGTTIAFTTSPRYDCTAIHLLDVRSGDRRPLTSCVPSAHVADSPAWQPDTTAGAP